MLASTRDQLVAVDKMAKMAELVKEVEMESEVQIVLGLSLVGTLINISIMETFPSMMKDLILLKVVLGVLKEKDMLELQLILNLHQHMPGIRSFLFSKTPPHLCTCVHL